ncbi:MAG: tyrosine-protein phosphatase [Clostridia bacterium]|nr:tyrosine-protein phosphatase [Clostridia bacterium]
MPVCCLKMRVKYGTITVYAKGDGKNFFDGKKAEIRYDSREILAEISGFAVNGTTLTWAENEKAEGYKVKINGNETSADKAEYVITERGYIVVEVKALGNGTTTADGEYVVACSGDFFLDDRYLADFTAGYEKLVDNDVNSTPDLISDYFIENYSAKFVEDGNYTEITLNELKWTAYGAIRVKFPNAAATGKYAIKYKVTGINGENLSVSNFRIIEREGGWVYEKGATTFDGNWAYAEVTLDEKAFGGLVFVFDGASVNGIKLSLDYIVKVEKLAAPGKITVENSSKTLSWDAVPDATAYEIVKDGEVWKTITETTVSCEGIGTFDVLGVRAVGGIGYETSEMTAAKITLSGDEWVEIAGSLKIVGHAYWTPGLIQLEFDKAGMNASETIDFGKLVIEANGERIAVTKFEYGNEVKFNVYANYPESYSGGVSTVVFKAGSVLIQNSKLYKIENDYTVVYNGSDWIALAGEINVNYVGWSSNTQIQINNLDLSYLEYGTVKFLGSISSNGAEITPVLTYHADPKTLDITGNYDLTSPRTIYLDGVSNTRDIGGYKSINVKKLKQGMIYRGGNPDDITENGLAAAIGLYGIKTQLDLRTAEEAEKRCAFGESVNYINVSGAYYIGGKTGLDFEDNKSVIANELRVFTEEKNYPVYFHCALGRDRTGTLAMLIEGLCGVSESDILLDYELSSLSVSGTKDKNKISYMINNLFKPTIEYIKGFGDGSLQSGCEKFLTSCGLTKTEINKIIEIMVA